MALRDTLTTALKESMKAGDQRRVSTVRMIMAALKERDIDARGKGNPNGIEEGDIQRMMQGLIKQRREAIELYKQGNRPELAQLIATGQATMRGLALAGLAGEWDPDEAWPATREHILAMNAQVLGDPELAP